MYFLHSWPHISIGKSQIMADLAKIQMDLVLLVPNMSPKCDFHRNENCCEIVSKCRKDSFDTALERSGSIFYDDKKLFCKNSTRRTPRVHFGQ